MTEVSGKNFGLAIAYLLPGFVFLWTTSDWLGELQTWFGGSSGAGPTVAGFLYVTLASLAAGLTLSAVRWCVVDGLHHSTGVRKPDWDFSQFQAKFTAFEGLVENHYRYYQFYASMFLVLLIATAHPRRLSMLLEGRGYVPTGIGILLIVLFFVASRDALQKYYARTGKLLANTF